MAGRPALVGRERELDAVGEAVSEGPQGLAALALDGPAGIGKTSVWRASVDGARERGLTVLAAQASTEDARLAFSGLADLFDEVEISWHDVSVAKRHALERAILLSEGDEAIDRFAVSAGVLAVIRQLAASDRVLIAIDDVRWLDPESAFALAFSARRLTTDDVRFLLTDRTPAESPDGALLDVLAPDRLTLEPLSFGAISRVLRERLDLTLSRVNARRLYDTSAGNALLAIELGRSIAATGGAPSLIDELSVAARIDKLLAGHVARLSPPAREALLTIALGGATSLHELAGVVDEEAIEEAVEDAVLVLDAGRVRAAHPMLAMAATSAAGARERRALHRRIAASVEDEERRALHLARATAGTSSEVAATVAEAAAAAARRGAATTAAELAEHAVALTSPSDPVYSARLLDVAQHLHRSGALRRVIELLEPALARLPAGPMRARALCLLDASDHFDSDNAISALRQALAEGGESSELRVDVQVQLARWLAVGHVRELGEAERLGWDARRLAARLGYQRGLMAATASLIWTRGLRGRPLGELASAPPGDQSHWMYEGCERALAVNHMWRGDVATARDAIESLLALADERGEAESYYALRVQLCELELRAGRFDVVLRLLGEWAREPEPPVGGQVALLRCRALLAFRRGDATACAKLAAEAIAQADAVGVTWQRLEALRALGLAALLSGDAPGACQIMRQVWEHLVREGVENPGAFPVAPDFVDALTRAGELDEARHVVDRLAAQARAYEHPWGAAAAKRAEGQLLLARGAHASAADALAEAAAEFQELELPFDRARSLLGLGIAQRLLRRRRDARGSLEDAAKSFRRLDAAGWAGAVDGELRRISGRRESGKELTSTEQRVAELVAQGLANKQIASGLVVSVRTVEAHLTRIYAKLGVGSRTELVRVLSDFQPG